MTAGRHEGRTAVVTGAARGIGRAYARKLAAEGARVILADLGDTSETEALIGGDGLEALSVGCDVSDPDSIGKLGEEIAALGGADILVHNAGIYPIRPFAEITYEDWRRVMSVNLDSLFLLSQALVPRMRQRGWGRIVAISTGMFHAGAPGSLHYVASKAGVIGFVRSLAPEIGGDGVTINAIAPGLIRTEGTSTGLHDDLGLFDYVKEASSMKRNGVPEDLTGLLSFLVSDDASFITGQTVLVDGGLSRG